MAHRFIQREEIDGFRLWRHEGNGLTAITCMTPVAPVVSFCVVYRVGSRFEATGHTGATHLLEHLMFKGTERFNREKGTGIARMLQRVGASFNATTWLDRTSYFETLAAEHLPLAMEIEADRMRGALIREEDLANERTVVLNELERGENDPFDLLLKHSFAQAYVEHPYHHPTIGWRYDVENVSADVLRHFYDTYYHPDNATAIIIGDIEEGAVLGELERWFGHLPPAPHEIPRVIARESEQRGERRFKLHRGGEVGWVSLAWHIPEALHKDLPPLSVLGQILAEGVTSRLYQELVESNRCLGVHAFAWELHDPGLFQIVAALAPGVEHEEVEEIIRSGIERVRNETPDPSEVERAKVQVRTDLAFHRESPEQMAMAITEGVAMGDWTRFARQMDLVQAVTPDDLTRVAGFYLHDPNLTVGWFVPEHGGGEAAAPKAASGPKPCYYRAPFSERVVQERLPGGTRLAVLTNPHAPTVTFAGSLLAGPALVADGRPGIASLTASMLDRGTQRHTRMELARELEDHGLQLDVDASASAPTLVTFSAQGLAEEMPRLASLLIEVLREPVFPAEELDKLRTQVLGQLARERQETFPTAFGALSRRLYPAGHPHHRRRVDVREREVATVSRDDLAAFHETVYGPASLIIAVVGDVDPRKVSETLRRVLAGWEGGVLAPPPAPAPLQPQPGEDLIDIPDRPNIDMLLGHAAALTRDAGDFAAAVLANACLGYSTLTSRLGVEVRDKAGLTYGVYSRFFGTLHVPGPWAVYLGVAPGNLRRAEDLCRTIVDRFVIEGPSGAEVDDERRAQAGSFQVSLATNSGVARELVGALTSGLGVGFLDEYPHKLLATGRDEIASAARRYLDPERLVLAAAGSIAKVAR
ncbi:MAG: insulinase family protein [Acidobacteria bacterium]|nr:insulinase family protein [Acidobacteriota bacterium]